MKSFQQFTNDDKYARPEGLPLAAATFSNVQEQRLKRMEALLEEFLFGAKKLLAEARKHVSR